MDLIEAFVLNGTPYSVNIRWENKRPLFRASQITHILGIKKANSALRLLSEEHKQAFSTDTPGGPQQAVFLTEKGMYRLVMASRKPIAHAFHDWICDVLITIRETGRYDVAEELAHAAENNTSPEQVHALEILQDRRIRHNQIKMFTVNEWNMIYNNKNDPCIYTGIPDPSDPDTMKFGEVQAGNLEDRIRKHKRTWPNFLLIHVSKCKESFITETSFKKHPAIIQYVKRAKICNVLSNELITIGEGLTLQTVKDTMDHVAKCNIHSHTQKEAAASSAEDAVNKQIQLVQLQLQLALAHNQGLQTQLQLFQHGNAAPTTTSPQHVNETPTPSPQSIQSQVPPPTPQVPHQSPIELRHEQIRELMTFTDNLSFAETYASWVGGKKEWFLSPSNANKLPWRVFGKEHANKYEIRYRRIKPWLTYMDSLADQRYDISVVFEKMNKMTLTKLVPRSVFIKNCFYSWLKPPKEGAKKLPVISKADMERFFTDAQLPFPYTLSSGQEN